MELKYTLFTAFLPYLDIFFVAGATGFMLRVCSKGAGL